ncbi:MAG TPA: transporter [Candidatus Acidoferrales bacterium]|nr:transporter [Candidatus Acidoferrales bacterium]
MYKGLRGLFFIGSIFAAGSARAQLSGTLANGQYGLQAGTQASESLVVSAFVYDFVATSIVGPNGNTLGGSGSSNVLAAPGLNLWWVTPLKILGANYAVALAMWGSSSSIDYPRLDVTTSSYGFGDMYFKPFELGWHTTYVDAISGFGLYFPTGRYTPGANNNSGLGQWGYEFSAGATAWFDKKHSFNLATLALYDLYSPKTGGPVGPQQTNLQTGNTFSLQGGLGYQMLGGGLNVGIPFFLQWKVTEDTLPPGTLPAGVLAQIQGAKSFSVGLGAEAALFWSETDGIDLRWVQSFAGKNTADGPTFFVFYNHLFYFTKK